MSARSRMPSAAGDVDPRPMFYVFNEIAQKRKGPIPGLGTPLDRATQQKQIRERVAEKLRPPRQGPPTQSGPKL
ncbi:hypothetical protein DN545_30985 [Burkholderia multivorans]|nr:hypothetical protein DN545_30985 [Burkholderia multivorans]